MSKTKTKPKTTLTAKKNKVVAHITPETLFKDGGLFDAVALLCAVFNRKQRRPCVRQATISGVRMLTTVLLAQDKDVPDLLRLLDKDAVASGDGRSTVSEFVQAFERKKAVRGR